MMLFFKPKADEMLPPPPPPFDEEKPKFFDEIVEAKTNSPSPEMKEFNDLIKELEAGASAKNGRKTLLKVKPKKAKPIKSKAARGKKVAKKGATDDPEDFSLEGLELPGLELPEQSLELPDGLEGIDLGDFESAAKDSSNSAEASEAREEIRNAIERIKKQENPSFFSRLFGGRTEEKSSEPKAENIPAETSGIDAVQEKIKSAKNSLAALDLQKAKKDYIDAMQIYNGLDESQKSKVYEEIRNLYFERKNAEAGKV